MDTLEFLFIMSIIFGCAYIGYRINKSSSFEDKVFTGGIGFLIGVIVVVVTSAVWISTHQH